MKDTTSLPPVSLALFAYRQERYIRAAVESVLAQDHAPLQILLSDDCSPDRTFEIMQEVVAAYDGPHEVVLNRNPRNLGLAAHVNAILKRCRGEIIVLAAGDDISLPTRVRDTVAGFAADPDLVMLSLCQSLIDQDGHMLRPAERRSEEIDLQGFLADTAPHPSGAARGMRRQVFDVFGDLNPACPTEDTTFLFRALLLGKLRILPQEGIAYRAHDLSLSAPASRATMLLQNIQAQYLADLDRARARSLVSEPAFADIRSALERKFARRKVNDMLRYGADGRLRKLSAALFQGDFPLRRRVRLVRLALSRRR
jgi:glycosyltransferase involved in cell wall biosynthesis